MSRRRLAENEESEEYVSLWQRCQRSVFKLETLQSYGADVSPGFAEFQRGDISESKRLLRGLLLDDPAKPYELIKANGLSFERIHIVELPISEYLKYEIESYFISEEFGERILFVLKEDILTANLPVTPQDFLLFDDNVLILQAYNEAGGFLSSELLEGKKEVGPYVNLKKILYEAAIPMSDFLKKHTH